MRALWNRRISNKTRQQNREDFLATGSSMNQLELVREMVENAELSDRERGYFRSEVFPMLISTFEGAKYGRIVFFKFQKISLGLTFVSTVLGAVSATSLVNENIKYLPLLAIAIIGAISTWQQTTARMRQPALDWMSSRLAYDETLSEVINRIAGAGRYASLNEEERFLEMAERINTALYASESRVQSLIRTFQETMTDDVCQERKESNKAHIEES
jgi:hypothetical protein